MGFEPTVPLSRDNGFQDRRIRPLCHLSGDRFNIDNGSKELREINGISVIVLS